MRLDFDRHDILIHIAANRRESGIWAVETFAKGLRPTRKAGKQGAGFHNHSLLSLATVNGLRSISKRMRETFAYKAGVSKPRALIVSRNADFIASMQAVGTDTWKPTRSGRNFSSFLAKTLKMYSAEFVLETDRDGFTIPQLLQWADLALMTPDTGMPTHLQHSVASATV